MSITETSIVTPKPKRRTKARRKRAAPAARPKPVAYLTGLTVTNCAAACTAAGCIISGRSYCGHPHKGGLHGADFRDESAVKRLDDAKKMLGKAKINLAKL